MNNNDLKQKALDYHENPTPGKLALALTKPTNSQDDLSLAYTPGVAEPVLAIKENPENVYRYTAKGNLVGVITNGTAVLGLGDVGALASKPVMEGKAVLFKRFADIDVFDIEVDARSVTHFIDTVEAISPTFAGINLEDIKAPDCFVVEKALQERLNIPVFHDDQHGTAIIIAAGLLNACEVQNKQLSECKIVCVGAGAAGIASMNLLLKLGANPETLLLLDSKGVIHDERDDLNEYKKPFAIHTPHRQLEDAIVDADVFIGVAKADLVTPKMLKSMAANPIVFALSNPNPEIQPSLAHQVRDDVLMATGRSDFPNQVNNVLCFPYIFRGALDANASSINIEMQLAAVHAIKDLAHEAVPESVLAANKIDSLEFGSTYILPKPMDPRLKEQVSEAVKQAALLSGVVREASEE